MHNKESYMFTPTDLVCCDILYHMFTNHDIEIEVKNGWIGRQIKIKNYREHYYSINEVIDGLCVFNKNQLKSLSLRQLDIVKSFSKRIKTEVKENSGYLSKLFFYTRVNSINSIIKKTKHQKNKLKTITLSEKCKNYEKTIECLKNKKIQKKEIKAHFKINDPQKLQKKELQLQKSKFNPISNLLMDELLIQNKNNSSPEFNIVQEFDNIRNKSCLYLLAKNPKFLLNKWEVLNKYATRMEGINKIRECIIFPNKVQLSTENGYTHSMAITFFLPDNVLSCYGPQTSKANRNCHGTALLASGIHSSLEYFDSPLCLPNLSEKAERVDLMNLSCGDLVYLKSGLKGSTKEKCTDGLHSLVYLSEDFCLSMNGFGKTLEFFTLKDVLNEYGYPDDTLDIQLKSERLDLIRENICVLRKK